MPILTIIAGPNGAGKSTHSNELLAHLNIEAFDFDKEFYAIWSRFDFDPVVEQGAFDKALELYADRKSEALKKGHDFAFETNYHTNQLFSTIDVFEASGYQLELIFICLESPEIAIERVKERVAKGGHAVSENTIRRRFVSGLSFLDQSFDRYNTVSIYLSKHKHIQGILIMEPKIKKIISFTSIPTTLEPQLFQLNEFVKNNQHKHQA